MRLSDRPPRHFGHIFPAVGGLERDRGLETGVDHAVFAARVGPCLIFIPVDGAHEFGIVVKVAVGDEITRGLPAFDVIGDVSPRGAFVIAKPGEKIQIKRGAPDLVSA